MVEISGKPNTPLGFYVMGPSYEISKVFETCKYQHFEGIWETDFCAKETMDMRLSFNRPVSDVIYEIKFKLESDTILFRLMF